MLYLIISAISLLVAGSSGYFAYYFIAIEKNTVLSIVFTSLFVASLIATMLFAFFFVNKKNAQRIGDLKVRLDRWRDISYHASKAGDEAFNELPIGILLYDKSYFITWSNAFAKKIFNSALNEMSLEHLSKELYDEIIADEKNITFTYNNQSYDVIHNAENDIIYLFDVTERENIKKRYNARITALGITAIHHLAA